MASNIKEFNILSGNNDDDDEEEEEDGDSDDILSDLSDEDGESGDGESEDEEFDIENTGAECETNSFEDDSERECCPICLNKFIGQDLGTPESCEHTFCFDCIKEWSKNINTCPIDRTEFNFIHLRAIPGGSILRKVKVKVHPKEAEAALQDSVTLCEVCHNGNREDRLLLCDGCDLAYHCECLDPPLYYIPIEEWFCPPCSGVLQNEAIAGPSGSRRRVIPRTRASEAVRSRVQNLRTGGSSAPCSTSRPRKAITTNSPRKRKRRSYKRTFKKVVQLARTKKDMTSGQKSKVGARGSTVIVTYRRRRKRRRTAKRKFSRRSLASTKVLPTPSTKQRIAKRLGISKPLQGSSLPQVKQPVGSRSTSRVCKMPTHSLFGNRNQLMDFNENFNEDITNIPSTSSAVSPRRRPSSDSFSSSTSSLNILDSIMAGQKLLHSKSDNIVIKTDGSLMLKGVGSNSKKVDTDRKVESDLPVHTPMSIALVKTGVKCLTSSSDKKQASVWEKNADISKAKNVTDNKRPKSCFREKILLKINSTSNNWSSKTNCSNSKLYTELSSCANKLSDKECHKKSSLSVMNMHKKPQEIPSRKKPSAASKEDINLLMDGFECDTSSDGELKLSNKKQTHILNKSIKKRVNSYLELERSNSNSTFTNFQLNERNHSQFCSDIPLNIPLQASKSSIKKEVLSDDETDTDAISVTENASNIKKEVLTDEETNVDTWIGNGINKGQEFDDGRIVSRIKTESIDSDYEPDIIKNCSAIQRVMSEKSESCCTYETELSDFEPSQSIINTVPNDISFSSLDTNISSKMHLQKMIKEEEVSDAEDYSQSLVSTADVNCVSQLISPYCSQSTEKSLCNKQGKGIFELHNVGGISYSTKSNICAKQYLDSCADNKQQKDTSKKTDISLPSQSPIVIDSSSEDEDMSCTQVAFSPGVIDSSSEDEDMPSTQVAPPPVAIDSSSEDDDLPCTQAISLSVSRENLSEDDGLPCTQAISLSVDRENLSENDDLPCTQAVSLSLARNNFNKDDDLPCTQTVSLSDARCNLSEGKGLPLSQAVSFQVANDKIISDCVSPSDAISNPNNNFMEILDTELLSTPFVLPKSDKIIKVCNKLPSTQIGQFSETKSEDLLNIPTNQFSDDEIPPTQINFEYLKPAVISNRTILSLKKSDNINKSFPSNVTSKANSVTEGKLPSTQYLETSAALNSISNTGSNNKTLRPSVSEDLPATLLFTENITLNDTQSIDVGSNSFNLPATQISNIPSNVLNVLNTCSTTESSILTKPQVFNITSKVINFPDTVVKTLANESCVLPATQVSCASKKGNITDFHEGDSTDELFFLPATQIFNSPSKGKSSRMQFEAILDESCSLPATEVSKENQLHCTEIENPSELFALPATQISNDSSKVIKVFEVPLTGNLTSETSDASAIQITNSSKETAKEPDTQALYEDCELFTLPATQISNTNYNLKETLSGSNEEMMGSHFNNLIHSKSLCSDNEPEKSNNMNDIISNIKHIVNSLTAKDSENPSFPDTHKNIERLHHDKIVSDNNLGRENSKSDLPIESTDTEDTLDEMNISNNSKVKDQEILQPNINDYELSHAKLKEIAVKLASVVPSKNVGIHKHLPQVIAKLPVKGHVKLKPSNRKTFSFEEVAKLEEPVKTLNNLSSNSKLKVNKNDVYENIVSKFNNMDDDEFPPTQRVNLQAVKNKPIEIKKLCIESNLSLTEVKSTSAICHELNNSRISKGLSDKFDCNSAISSVEGNEDFPATQLALCKKTDDKILKTSACISNKEFKAVEPCIPAQKFINKKSELSSGKNLIVLPAAQIQVFNNESFSDISMNIKEQLSNTVKKDLIPIKSKSSVNIISVKSHVIPKHSKHNETKKSSEFLDLDDLPATQAFNNVPEPNSSNFSKHSSESGIRSKCHQSKSSEINLVNVLPKKNFIAKTSTDNKPKDIIQGKTKESPLELEVEDFPAKQVCNDVSKKASRKVLDIPLDVKTRRNYQNNAFEINKNVNIATASFPIKKDSSKLKKLPEENTSNSTVCKRKNPFNDDDDHKQKKDCDVRNISQSKGSPEVRMKESADHNRGSKRSLEYKKNDKKLEVFQQRGLSPKKLKETPDKEQTPSPHIVEKCNHKKDKSDLPLLSDHRKQLSSKKVKDKSVIETTSKKQNFISHANSLNAVIVKQEKIDLGTSAESCLSNLRDSSASLNAGGVRLKSEDISDSLPATQAASSDQTNGANNDSIIKNILSPSSIKKEASSDDEISILELDVSNKTKIKEEIIIDDDADTTNSKVTNKSNCVVKCDKEIFTQTIDISSLKKEKCSETNEEILSNSKSQSSKITSKQSEKKGLESSSQNMLKCDKDTSVSKHADKSHKTMDKGRNSKDSHISKEAKQKKDKNNVFKSKPESTSHKHNTKSVEKSKNSTGSSKEKTIEKKLDFNSLKPKSSSDVKNSLKIPSEKQRVRSSEKENSSSSVKNNCLKNDIIITLKPSKKRHCHEDSEDNQKRRKYDYSEEKSESCSSESSSKMKNGSLKNTDCNIKLKTNCDLIGNRVSKCTPKSDISVESIKVLNPQVTKDSSKSSLTRDVKKVLSKQDLKEEIANEVKLVLKPFFSTGLITKDDYKDIMRRAVPKIFMNCHSCINPEKIRKLVHSYVSLLSKC